MKENVNLIIVVVVIFIIVMGSWYIGYTMGTNSTIEHYNNGDVPTKIVDKILENLKKHKAPEMKNKNYDMII